MKILFVTHRYYPHVGGVEYVVRSLAERLVKVGHDITVLAGEPSIKFPVREEINDVRVIRWPAWGPGDAYYIPKMRNRLEILLKGLVKDADVVHVHNAHAVLPVYAGIKIKKLRPSTKLVFTLHYHGHGHTLLRKLAWLILWRKYVAKLVNYADKIHSVSTVEAERVVKYYPEAMKKLVIIPNGVEEDVFHHEWRGQSGDSIVYAGRIEKYKRLEVAVDLIAELSRHGHDLRLLVIGKGPHLPKLMRYAQTKAHRRVEFIPPVPREVYLRFIADALAVINPSQHEAFSIFIAESLAIGTPAIVSHPIARIYHKYTSNGKHLLHSLSNILNKLGLTLLINTTNRELIKSWDKIINDIIMKLYK